MSLIFTIFVLGLGGSNYPLKAEAITVAHSFFIVFFKNRKMQKEIWKDVAGYEGYYKVSINGVVKAYDRIVKSSFNATRVVKGVVMKHHISNAGYYYVCLSKDRKTTHCFIHRLIAVAFIPNPENKKTVNHINSNRLDYNISNLEWATQSENIIHGFRYGFIKNNMTGRFGKDNPHSKSVVQLTMNGEFIKEFDSITSAQNETGCSNVSMVCNNKRKSCNGYKWKFKNETDI